MTNLGLATPSKIEPLNGNDENEVLSFLSRRPIHTVIMAGFIGDNGIISTRHRGTFYGYRSGRGQLDGVALIGEKSLIEAQDESVLKAFAHAVQANRDAHLLLGEQHRVEYLLKLYAEGGRVPRLLRPELLLEQVAPANGIDTEPDLRLAGRADLESLLSINAAMVYEESGVYPLPTDYGAMSERMAHRISEGRHWVLVESGHVIFKADIACITPLIAYVEGVYVSPQHRGKGHAERCLTQLARKLSAQVSSICLIVNEENRPARALYERVGYRLRSHYATAYFSAI